MNPSEAFKFCPRCGGKLEPKEESLKCSVCGFDFYINPIPCNGVIIENERQEILLVKRKFDPQKGYWDVPGGFIRPGETLADSVKREIKEELGVDAEMTQILGIYTDTYIYQEIANQTLGIVVGARILRGDINPADDVEEYKYFLREEVLKQTIAFPGMRRALEDYLNKTI